MIEKSKFVGLKGGSVFVFALTIVFFGVFFLAVTGNTDDVVQSVEIDAAPPSVTSVIVTTTSGGSDVSDFTPIESTDTVVYVRGSGFDYDGCSTIDVAGNWDIVLYRSGVSGGRDCSEDGNDCYHAVESGNISISGCSGGADTDLNFEIPVSLEFWADPTDYGAPFAAQNWIASVRAIDDDSNYSTSTDTFELNSLIALDAPSTIDYGSVRPGESSAVKELSFTQTGNRAFDLDQTSTGDTMVCNGTDSDNIPWTNVEMALSRYFVYGTGIDLSAKQHISELTLAMPQRLDDANPATKSVYFRLQVPSSGVNGTCSGTTRFTAKAAS